MSQPFVQLLDNGPLAWGLAACGLAQLSKLLIELVVHRRWRPAVLIETGGMPSSHSALVTGTAACIGLEQGFDAPLFALAAAVAFVVMYDASGVRRAAGRTAERVNALPEAQGITDDLRRNLVAGAGREFEFLVVDLAAKRIGEFIQQLVKAEGNLLHFDLPRLDLGKVEDVVDELEQRIGGL